MIIDVHRFKGPILSSVVVQQRNSGKSPRPPCRPPNSWHYVSPKMNQERDLMQSCAIIICSHLKMKTPGSKMKTEILCYSVLYWCFPLSVQKSKVTRKVTSHTYKKVQTDSEGVHTEVKRYLFLNNYFSYSKGRGALTTSFRKEGNVALVLFGISKHKHWAGLS